MIYLEVEGEPIAWKRPGHRSYKQQNQNKIAVFDAQKKEKEMVKWQMSSQFKTEKLTGPLFIILTFMMPIPKSATKKMREQMKLGLIHHMKRPDGDNLTKFIFDCMNDFIFLDDSQVSAFYAKKKYSEHPSTLIRIRPYEFNSLQDEFNEIEELERNEYHTRENGWGELHRSSADKERIVQIGGEDPPLKTV